jgi:hypothetical protein
LPYLGTLFERNEGGDDFILKLRFLPDTSEKNTDALLLLLFGYRRIYRLEQVGAARLEDGLRQSGCHPEPTIGQIMMGQLACTPISHQS